MKPEEQPFQTLGLFSRVADQELLHVVGRGAAAGEVLLIDNIFYIPFRREETDVLFQLINQRYERRSVLITSNLPKTVFHDEMATTALIDRLVHPAAILELNAPSYRTETAKKRKKEVPTS